jgi:hypothetical protein
MKLIFALYRVAEWVLSKISCGLIHQLLGIWISIVMKLSPVKQIPSLVFFENVPAISSGLWLLHSKPSMLSLVSSCVVSQIDTLRPTGRSCEVMLRFTSKRNLVSVSFASYWFATKLIFPQSFILIEISFLLAYLHYCDMRLVFFSCISEPRRLGKFTVLVCSKQKELFCALSYRVHSRNENINF